jgi:hypothetical protein
MNSSGYHEMKEFPKENNTQSNWKIHAHDLLESAQVLEKGRKFNTDYYITEILEPLS